MDPADTQKLARIFLPYAMGERDRLKNENIRLAYYTHAETANKIIRNREFWLRDSQKMNDASEVKHGTGLIDTYFGTDANRNAFFKTFDAIFPGVANDALKLFEDWKLARRAQTFFMSFSRHAPPDSVLKELENMHGRLSMWRGYGGHDGVALIFRPPFNDTNNLRVFLSPVAYRDSIDNDVARVIEEATKQTEFLSRQSAELLRNTLFVMLIMAATCLKHPGFREEDEWRLIYLPSTYHSDFVRELQVKNPDDQATETVYRIAFSDMVRAGIPTATADELIERVIVGPSVYPDDIGRYIAEALTAAGVRNPELRVHASTIPFRFPKPRIVPA